MNTAKRSAASRKAWRTRKRMQHARLTPNSPEYKKALAARVKKLKTWLKPGDCVTIAKGTPYETTVLIVADSGSSAWPDYMRRALPLPEFGKGK